ncbi:hypothetical protein ACF08N_24335 [Streptomyces sp. NPDC015127]|uniref:hypothetical protein n=1 Tax=Streptomyces sp. NPDC015127 TaxID=3364939 RepID=UPI0036FA9FA0
MNAAKPLAPALLCTLLATACGGSSAAGETSPLEDMAARLHTHVAKVWPHTGRIWPGADYSRNVLLITDGRAAYAVDTAGHREVPLADLTASGIEVPAYERGFDAITWKGRRGIVVRPQMTVKADAEDPTGFDSGDAALRTFGLATHEQFHSYVQQDAKGDPAWASLPALADRAGGVDDRAQHYPTEVEPRSYRTMVYNSLLAAYQDPQRRRDHLAAAAYWQQTWARTYPNEAKSQPLLDTMEGSARYVESMAVAMATVEDPRDREQIRTRLTGTLRPLKSVNKGFEPYAIGATALFTADAMSLDARKRITEEPVTPQQVVLRGVKPVRQTLPADVRRALTANAARADKKIAPDIEPFVAGMRDKKKWVLLVPQSAAKGTLGGTGFYTTDQLPLTIIAKARLSFALDGGGSLSVNGRTVAEVPLEGELYYGTPLDPADPDVSLKGDRLVLKSPELKGEFTVRSETDDGQRVLYARTP